MFSPLQSGVGVFQFCIPILYTLLCRGEKTLSKIRVLEVTFSYLSYPTLYGRKHAPMPNVDVFCRTKWGLLKKLQPLIPKTPLCTGVKMLRPYFVRGKSHLPVCMKNKTRLSVAGQAIEELPRWIQTFFPQDAVFGVPLFLFLYYYKGSETSG